MIQHVHNWYYMSSQKGVHVTRECRCGQMKETTPRGVTYLDRLARPVKFRAAAIPEVDELNNELNRNAHAGGGLDGNKH